MMDPEVVELCQQINSLPGLQTTESCCGHGEHGLRIWFGVDEGEHRGLFLLTSSIDDRYWRYGNRWDIKLSVADHPESSLPICFLLESKDVGPEAYAQANDLVENIKYHRRHTNFLTIFGLQELALPGVFSKSESGEWVLA